MCGCRRGGGGGSQRRRPALASSFLKGANKPIFVSFRFVSFRFWPSRAEKCAAVGEMETESQPPPLPEHFEYNIEANLDGQKLSARVRKEAKIQRREERRVEHWQRRRHKAREKKKEQQRLKQEAVERGEQPAEEKKKNHRISTSVPLAKNWPRLVIDLDFQDFLNAKVAEHRLPVHSLLVHSGLSFCSRQEKRSVASQIGTAYGWCVATMFISRRDWWRSSFAALPLAMVYLFLSARTRHHARPLELHLTCLKGQLKKAIDRNNGSYQWQLGKHEQSFMEVFKDQTDKLIYLSPDSPNILQRLQPDHIYIIGGIADVHIKKVPPRSSSCEGRSSQIHPLVPSQGLTLDKAEQFNIQTASLPVKQFTKSSRTVLNINHG